MLCYVIFSREYEGLLIAHRSAPALCGMIMVVSAWVGFLSYPACMIFLLPKILNSMLMYLIK